MKRRKFDRIACLINRYPALGLVRADHRFTDSSGRRHDPQFNALEVNPEPDYLLFQGGGFHADQPNSPQHHRHKDWRASREIFLQAIGHDERVAGTMRWRHPVSQNERLKDIFKYIPRDQIKSIFIVDVVTWHQSSQGPDQTIELSTSPVAVGVAVTVIACPAGGWKNLEDELDKDTQLLESVAEIVAARKPRQRMKIFKAAAAQLLKD